MGKMRTYLIGASILFAWLIAVGLAGPFAAEAAETPAPETERIAGEETSGVHIAATPDDPLMGNQRYLQMIEAEKAWDTVAANEAIIIAVVDTGVDLNHPDLAENLVPGLNLIEPGKPPQDDNGHGTNVAGVIAAVANNDRGVAGLLWRAKIMPVKALEADGSGDERKLGEGILYAVERGAKIVVLSLGLNKPSDYLEQIVRYAEERGVLLVAAVGNEGGQVKYPAAYPTVLAVGGISSDKTREPRSNSGQEVDLVAPWDVFTTALGGRYGYQNGTSMAAPQVAGVAALVWSRYPDLEPYQLRNLLRQTAEDIGPAGWDPQTGFGMLRADRAVQAAYRENLYVGNHTVAQAAFLPAGTEIAGTLPGNRTPVYFAMDFSYNGTIRFGFEGAETDGNIRLIHYADPSGKGTVYERFADAAEVPVTAGKHFFRFELKNERKEALPYRLTTEFLIEADAFEDNDRAYKAYRFPEGSRQFTGTFHKSGDEDWFVTTLEKGGILKVKLSVDSVRFDPVLLIQKAGERELIFDQKGDGGTESAELRVQPGTYYFRAGSLTSYSKPLAGKYTLDIVFETELTDPNEPNNRAFEATALLPDVEYGGVFSSRDDTDWFVLRLAEESDVTVRMSNLPESRTVGMSLYNYELTALQADLRRSGTELTLNAQLAPGTYYIRLQADAAITDRMYQLKASVLPLLAGYNDIAAHWAREAIVKLTEAGIVSGYGDHRFRPDQPLTRAEAVTILTKIFEIAPSEGRSVYRDITPRHWAYQAIMAATDAGMVSGYPDGSFRPDRPVTRMEMTMMLAGALGLGGSRYTSSSYVDVDSTYWGAAVVQRMTSEGWISGYEDGTFRPDRPATRAEFAAIAARILG